MPKKTTQIEVLEDTIPVREKGQLYDTTLGHRVVIKVGGMAFYSLATYKTPDEGLDKVRGKLLD